MVEDIDFHDPYKHGWEDSSSSSASSASATSSSASSSSATSLPSQTSQRQLFSDPHHQGPALNPETIISFPTHEDEDQVLGLDEPEFDPEKIESFFASPTVEFFSSNPGFDVNQIVGFSDGENLLHRACREGRRDVLNVLMTRKDLNLDAKNGRKETPLHLAAKGGYADFAFMESLASKVQNINAMDDGGRTPLWRACDQNNMEAVVAIMRRKKTVHPNLPDLSNTSPLQRVVDNDNDPCLILLLMSSPLLDTRDLYKEEPSGMTRFARLPSEVQKRVKKFEKDPDAYSKRILPTLPKWLEKDLTITRFLLLVLMLRFWIDTKKDLVWTWNAISFLCFCLVAFVLVALSISL